MGSYPCEVARYWTNPREKGASAATCSAPPPPVCDRGDYRQAGGQLWQHQYQRFVKDSVLPQPKV